MTDRNLASRFTRYWITAALVTGSLVALILWRERPPTPKPASAPTTEFSADRAWPILSYLADTIGYRVSGTPGARRAEDYLVARLRQLPGVEVEVQEVDGARPGRDRVTAYTLRNVLVRIPGRSREALLLSAHYDTPPGSVGAGDDAVAVASLVEIVRALAAGPRLAHTILVVINDGEEQGLLGAHGFVQHPWFRDVRAFVNLEGAGPHGKAILFQAGVGGGWLVSAYARSVPYPYGTVLAQDIFQSGAIPSDTDFRIYRDDGGLVGLDIALYRGGWAYHTQRDRPWNVSRGTVQHMGENAIALARSIASGPLAEGRNGERAVYYDVLGAFMPHYSERGAKLLAIAAIVLGVAALALAARRGIIVARTLLTAFPLVALSALIAPVIAMGLGAVAAYAAGQPMSWFAHPWWATTAFAFAALAGVLAVQRLSRRWREAEPEVRGHTAHAALLLFWLLVLAGLSVVRLGSAYIALWWVVGLAATLAAAALARGRRWWLWFLLGTLPAGMLTIQLLILLSMLFVPVFGRLPLAVAPDPVLAAIVAVPATAIALALAAGAHRAGRLGRASLGAAAAALALLGVSLLQQRYTDHRPQRLAIVHVEGDSTSALHIYGMDYSTPRLALARDSAVHPIADRDDRQLHFVEAAGPTGFPAPRLELLEEHSDSAGGTRTLTFRALPDGAFRLRILTPHDRIVGWSLPVKLPSWPSDGGYLQLDYVAPPDTGVRFSLRVRGEKHIFVRTAATRFVTTPAAAALMRSLPGWTDAYSLATNEAWWYESRKASPGTAQK